TLWCEPKKKVQDITNKFEWKKWRVPIILLGIIIVGGIFSLFAKESEDRYADLKINEEQKIATNPEEQSVGNYIDNTLLQFINFMPIIIIILVMVAFVAAFVRLRD
ncbi:hypothetical protein LCGC14_2446180, partial [marine sediment metagenome]